MPTSPRTKFAPPDRADPETLRLQQSALLEDFDPTVFDTLPITAMVLNGARQIVYANQRLLDLVAVRGQEDVVGLRPGELFHCVHAETGEAGCGTSDSCAYCGALRAVLEAGHGEATEREGKVMVRLGDGRFGAFSLRVNAAPVAVGEATFILVYLQNIVDSKLKEMLEQTFFHDVKNAMNGIIGVTTMLRDEVEDDDTRELADMVLERSRFLEREIDAHRMILFAERDMLEVEPVDVDPGELCANIRRLFASNGNYAHLDIVAACESARCTVNTDQRILFRVLENLIKNACEASGKGDTVRFGYRLAGEGVEFFVNNRAHMTTDVQRQVFQRAFTTKGKGRGIGTFSTRMLTENYLAGEVAFTSDGRSGTTFVVRLPLSLSPEAPPGTCEPRDAGR